MLEVLIGLLVGGVAGYAWPHHQPDDAQEPLPAPTPKERALKILDALPQPVEDYFAQDRRREAEYNSRLTRMRDDDERGLRRREEDRHAEERGKLVRMIDALKARLGEGPYEGETHSAPPAEVANILERLTELEKR